MARPITVGSLTDNGSLSVKVAGLAAQYFMLEIIGTGFGGGTLTFEASPDGTNFAPIYVLDRPTANWALYDIGTIRGTYPINVIAHTLRFTLAGATAPGLDMTLFPQARG